MTQKTLIGMVLCALPIPEGSKAGHDQLLIYVEDADGNIAKVWETLAPSICAKGRNAGKSYREVRLEELGIPNFLEAEERLLDARAIITWGPQTETVDGVTTTRTNDKGEPLYSWTLDRILHKKQASV